MPSIVKKQDIEKLGACGADQAGNKESSAKTVSPCTTKANKNKKELKRVKAEFWDKEGKKQIDGITKEGVVMLKVQWQNISDAIIELNTSDDLIFSLAADTENKITDNDRIYTDTTQVLLFVKFKN